MFRKVVTTIALIGILIPLWGCQNQSESQTKEVIVLGDIALNPARKQRFQGVADYLAANLGQTGIGQGEVKIASDKETMAQWIKSGEVDLYMDSPYPAMYMVNQTGAKVILRRWKKGVAEYSTIFFARQDSDLKSLEDLKGKMLALEVPFSSSGYMFPLSHLIKSGMNPVEKAEANHEVPKNQVGYVFAGDDLNAVRWVLSKNVDAGATDSETFAGLPESQRSQLVVLAETKKFPRQVVVAAPDMDPKVLEEVKEVLMKMHKNKEGKEILQKFKKTAKFDQFPQEPKAALAQMEEYYQLVQGRDN